VIQLTADDSQDASDQRDADSFPGHRVPTPSSRPSTSAQGLTFATALTLTAGVVLGATEGALAKLLGVPLAIVIAFLCVRAAGHHGQPRGAMRDGLLIAGVLVGVVLSAAVVIASLKAAPSSGPAPPVATNTKASGEASIATHTKAPASGAESELSRHVPATFRASCQRITRTGTADQLPQGTTAALSCHPDVGAAEVRYYRWLSPGQMDETFRFWLTTGSKFCKLDGKPMRPRDYSTSKGSGSVYCVDIGNGQVILNWTVDDMRVNAEAHADRGGLKALYDWWKGGGLWV
jgi:hypothetical protein